MAVGCVLLDFDGYGVVEGAGGSGGVATAGGAGGAPAGDGYTQLILSESELLAYYPFSSPYLADAAVLNATGFSDMNLQHDGEIESVALAAPLGMAVRLTGDQLLQGGAPFLDKEPQASLSIELWIRWDALPGAVSSEFQPFIVISQPNSGQAGYHLMVYCPHDGVVGPRCDLEPQLWFHRAGAGDDQLGPDLPELAGPHHVVASYLSTANEIALWVNGEQVASKSDLSPVVPSGGGEEPFIRIGRGQPPAVPVTFIIDELAIYGRALDGATILRHYTCGTTNDCE